MVGFSWLECEDHGNSWFWCELWVWWVTHWLMWGAFSTMSILHERVVFPPHTPMLLSEPFPTDMVWGLRLLGPPFQRLFIPVGISPSQLKGSSDKTCLGCGVLMVPCGSGSHRIPRNPGSHRRSLKAVVSVHWCSPEAPRLESQGRTGYVLLQLFLFPSLLWLCHQALKPVWRLFLLY